MKLWILLVGFFIISLILNTEGFISSSSFDRINNYIHSVYKPIIIQRTTKGLSYEPEKSLPKHQIDSYNKSIPDRLPRLPMINYLSHHGVGL